MYNLSVNLLKSHVVETLVSSRIEMYTRLLKKTTAREMRGLNFLDDVLFVRASADYYSRVTLGN